MSSTMATTELASSSPASLPPAAATKQPGVLYMLFSTEAWERFSYYGMRAILVLYMTKVLTFEQSSASKIYGWYTGLVYLTPLLGGWLADRALGYRKAIILGGFVMAAGEFALATGTVPGFWLGLGLLILGNGFFKPNISTIVGTLYEDGDTRRDRGFTIFYMGINLGAFFSPIICGQMLAENTARFGFHSFNYGFAAAGVGMLVGNLTFIIGQKFLGKRGRTPREMAADAQVPAARADSATKAKKVAEPSAPLTKEEVERVIAIFIVGIFVVFFWMAFEQAGNTMTTWADTKTNQDVFGLFQAKASLFQAVNPLFVVSLAPVVSWVWKILEEKNLEPSTPAKMVLGISLVGVGFIPMVMAAMVAGDHGKASWVFLVATYLLHTIGELCLSPVGLSLVTKLAPKKLAALLMGVWFLAVFAGNFLAGQVGSLYESMSQEPGGYVKFFSIFVATSLGAALVMFVALKPIKRLMHGVH
ncbi:MAG TPA: peptide MFS transporter [Polyangiaceae bacterium]|jgi:POT family proton-dependent oligopeptide transporter